MLTVRQVLVGLGLAFSAYLAARGLWWTGPVAQPLLFIAALVLYLLTTWLCLFWEIPGGRRGPASVLSSGARGPSALPVWAGVLALVTALVVPNVIAIAVGPDARTAPYATWTIGGIGALMTIVMVRRRPVIAWIGTAALSVESMTWMTPPQALALGVVGSVVWVGAAQLLLLSMDRAARDAERLAELQRAASSWQASQAGRQRERRVQVQRALAVAGPVLGRAIATAGVLDDDERLRARVAEGALRDELRGPRLLDDDVREGLADARRRGVTVTVLDEGGLEGLDDDALAEIRRDLAATVRGARSDRIYIRTSADDDVAVTVVGRTEVGEGLSDEDSVDLWREIGHPRPA